MRIAIVLIPFLILLASCTGDPSPPESAELSSTTRLFHGGDILTMSGDSPEYVEALVTEGDRIALAGTLAEAEERFPEASRTDLSGRTLLPGFIDAHAHFGGFHAQAVGAKILPPPDATVSSIDDLIEVLREWATPENVALTGWIFGMGFDDSVIDEKRFATRDDLDQVSTEHPVMVIHISGHFASVNSKGLELLGIDADTPDPEGGIIRRVAGTSEPNGVLEELAAIPFMSRAVSPVDEQAAAVFLSSGQEMALSYGYTTAQEGRAMPESHAFLASAAEAGKLKLDVVSYVDYSADSHLESDWYGPDYTNRYRIAGLKLTLDGSPQGRTAWITSPYLLPPDGAEEGYAGYPAIPSDDDVRAILDKAYRNDWQVLVHGNGDAAIDQLIRTLRPVVAEHGTQDRRSVLIHGQYVRDDQLDALHEMDVIASLFPLHTFYWGDWHSQLIGPEKGQRISPVRTAMDKGMKVTIHTDAPVALPNLMRVVWTAVARTSRSKTVIGAGERLTPYEALKCITDWSAYQHFEEAEKGTLEVGKFADLVILDRNPLRVEVDEIRDIVVDETIKSGATVYTRGSGEGL